MLKHIKHFVYCFLVHLENRVIGFVHSCFPCSNPWSAWASKRRYPALLLVVKVVQVVFYVSTSNHSIFQKNLISLENCDFQPIISLENCDFQRIISLENFFFALFAPEIQAITLYYWVRLSKNSLAEIDYLLPSHLQILPIEVKAGSQGGMKSLWSFMREKHLTEAIRCSLENFGSFSHTDKEDGDTARHVSVIPLYAVSQIIKITTSDRV